MLFFGILFLMADNSSVKSKLGEKMTFHSESHCLAANLINLGMWQILALCPVPNQDNNGNFRCQRLSGHHLTRPCPAAPLWAVPAGVRLPRLRYLFFSENHGLTFCATVMKKQVNLTAQHLIHISSFCTRHDASEPNIATYKIVYAFSGQQTTN